MSGHIPIEDILNEIRRIYSEKMADDLDAEIVKEYSEQEKEGKVIIYEFERDS